jgi:hypothetical protein
MVHLNSMQINTDELATGTLEFFKLLLQHFHQGNSARKNLDVGGQHHP